MPEPREPEIFPRRPEPEPDPTRELLRDTHAELEAVRGRAVAEERRREAHLRRLREEDARLRSEERRRTGREAAARRGMPGVVLGVVAAGAAGGAAHLYAATLIPLLATGWILPSAEGFLGWAALSGLAGMAVAPLVAWGLWPSARRVAGGFDRPIDRLMLGTLAGLTTAFALLLVAETLATRIVAT